MPCQDRLGEGLDKNTRTGFGVEGNVVQSQLAGLMSQGQAQAACCSSLSRAAQLKVRMWEAETVLPLEQAEGEEHEPESSFGLEVNGDIREKIKSAQKASALFQC